MSLQLSEVRAKFAASLLDAATVFGETLGSPSSVEAFNRHLVAACQDLARVRPRLVHDTMDLQSGTGLYPAPDDALRFHSADAVDINAGREPSEPGWIPVVPLGTLNWAGGARYWRLSPVPTQLILFAIGSSYSYCYYATYTLSEEPADSTVPDDLEPLLILRAQVEAMREIAIRNAHKPVQMRDGMYSQTRNGTPAAIADQLMRMFEQQAGDSAQAAQ